MATTRDGRHPEPAARLDAVEIKTTVTAADAGRALDLLELLGDAVRRRIYFCEGLGAQLVAGALPLLTSGVILRLRETEEADDSTVKLRPCRRSRLSARWLAFRSRGQEAFRLEADWSGARRTLAASLVARHDRGHVDDIMTGRRTVRSIFSDSQRQFLTDCADELVDFEALTVLGPVSALRWPRLRWQGYDVVAEQWTLPGDDAHALDFLELSLRVEPQGAEIVQVSFDALLRRHDIDLEAVERPKTQLMVEHLARTWQDRRR